MVLVWLNTLTKTFEMVSVWFTISTKIFPDVAE